MNSNEEDVSHIGVVDMPNNEYAIAHYRSFMLVSVKELQHLQACIEKVLSLESAPVTRREPQGN